jgi:hypothetical protein
MARLARVVVPGYPHHITQRGNRRLPTFFSDDDYRTYLAILQERCTAAGLAVWGIRGTQCRYSITHCGTKTYKTWRGGENSLGNCRKRPGASRRKVSSSCRWKTGLGK